MSNIIYTPYTYLIGWPEHNKWYYGVRFGKNCHPKDLWNSYKTSSKYVKAFLSMHGDPNIIEVRRTFGNSIDAKLWEEKVLRRMKVVQRTDFLNRTHTNNIKSEAISNGLLKYWSLMSAEERKQRAIIMRAGRKLDKENCEKLSLQLKNYWSNLSAEEKKSRNAKWTEGSIKYQNTLSKEEKIRRGKNAAAHVKIITCPICGKSGRTGNMNRWHFDNCKLK